MNFFTMLAEQVDLPILDFIATHLHCAFLNTVMPLITLFGEKGVFWILTAVVLLCIPKYRKAGISIGVALGIGLLLCNVVIKPLVDRPRPYDYQLQYYGKDIPLLIAKLSDGSFPSGHTAACFEGAGVLLGRDKRLGIPALVIAVLVAFSRMYLYVHYPTDVLAGALIGLSLGFLANFLVDRGEKLPFVQKLLHRKKDVQHTSSEQ